jgi:uncharacterized protein (DUF885 family)
LIRAAHPQLKEQLLRKSLLVFSLLLAACTTSVPPSSTTPGAAVPANSAMTPGFDATLHEYVAGFLSRYPVVATYLGGSEFDPSLRNVDATLRDNSPAAIAAEDAWLSSMRSRIDGFSAELTANQRIDRDVALAQIDYLLHLHQVRKYQQRALDTYTDEPFRGVDWAIQGFSQTGPKSYGTPAEWRSLIARVNAIPAFMANAKSQLSAGMNANNIPDSRMLFRNGLTTAEADAVYFEKTLPGIADERIAGEQRAALLAELREAAPKAAAAYRDLKNFIAANFFDDPSRESGVKSQFAGDRFAFGEREYNWALKNNLRIDKNVGQLYDESWPVVERTQNEMIALAREIGRAHNWTLPSDGYAAVRKVFDELGKDSPKNDEEMIGWYSDAAFRLVDYARRTGVFDVPADYKLEVTQTPPPLRSSIDGAAYYPAPPFKNSGVGRFYVTPTDNDPATLRDNNRAAIADLSAHEGFPGHDWHYKVMTTFRNEISPVRWLTPGAVEDSSSMWEDSMASEGWALYSEALMAEPQPGAPHGFYTPEERLYQLQGKLYRDLRVRIDTGIHTGRMKYDDAVSLFSQVVNFLPGSCQDENALKLDEKRSSCTSAERAIYRYSKWPTQAITYRLGKEEIFTLRDEARELLGERFSPKDFHLRFMKQGTIPAGYFRKEFLDQLKKH